MGFMDSLGGLLGDIAGGVMGKAQEAYKYKQEYESLSDNDIKREYQRVKDRSGAEFMARKMALMTIAKERGLMS